MKLGLENLYSQKIIINGELDTPQIRTPAPKVPRRTSLPRARRCPPLCARDLRATRLLTQLPTSVGSCSDRRQSTSSQASGGGATRRPASDARCRRPGAQGSQAEPNDYRCRQRQRSPSCKEGAAQPPRRQRRGRPRVRLLPGRQRRGADVAPRAAPRRPQPTFRVQRSR